MTHEPGEAIKAISLLIIYAGVAQGAFLSALFLARSARRKRGSRSGEAILSATMLAFTANIVHAAFIKPAILAQGTFHTALEPIQLLFGPLVFAYVRSLVRPSSASRGFVPAFATAAALLGVTCAFVLAGIAFGRDSAAIRILDSAAWVVTLAYLFLYLARTHALLAAHERAVRDEFADSAAVDLSWVRSFVLAFIAIEIVWALMLGWIVHESISPHFGYVNAMVSSLIVYALGFRALLQRQDVRLPEERPAPVPSVSRGSVVPVVNDAVAAGNGESPAGRYARSVLDETELESLKASLLGAMDRKRPWLEPDLNLQDLADACGMSRHTLTEVLSRSCRANFFDFVNSYRVQEFKRLASLPESRRFTLLALALDAGFNSKGTFNAVFKKHSGMTPSAWVRSGPETGVSSGD